MLGKARFIKAIYGWKGDVRLYELEPPMLDCEGKENRYVLVSKVDNYFVRETMIFQSNKEGNPKKTISIWGERGNVSHYETLFRAGYSTLSLF